MDQAFNLCLSLTIFRLVTGTTGNPKGVRITHRNIMAYLAVGLNAEEKLLESDVSVR